MATKRQRRERLARAEEARRREEREQKRGRALRTALIAVAAVVVLALAAFAYVWLSDDEPVVTPDGVTADGGILYPAAGNKPAADAVEVVVYEDPQCPHCRDFEEEHGQYLQDAADRGRISLEYRPIAFLGDDSVAPINAAVCVLDSAGPKAFMKVHDALFAGEDDLTGLAADAGAGGPQVSKCIESGKHDGWVDKVTSDASDDGVAGTPTVRIDGVTVDFEDLDDIESLIDESRS